MPRPTWKPASELTPFALMIREGYMWKREPSMSMAEFAEFAGVSKQSVLHWLRDGSKPKRDSVLAVAKATGIDVDTLLRAAGHPDTRMTQEERRELRRAYQAAMKRLTRAAESDPSISPRDRAVILAYVARQLKEALDSGEPLTESESAPPSQPPTPPAEPAADDDEVGVRRRRTPAHARR